jgi:copper(I)-binding protein
LLFALTLFVAFNASAQLQVDNAWTRATPPGAKVAVGYMVIRNASAAPDRLVGASSAAAARVETHVTRKDGDIMRMRPVKGYDIPPRGSFELKPGAAHLMFVDIRQPFSEGERIPVRLQFENAGEVRVEFHVSPLGGHKH